MRFHLDFVLLHLMRRLSVTSTWAVKLPLNPKRTLDLPVEDHFSHHIVALLHCVGSTPLAMGLYAQYCLSVRVAVSDDQKSQKNQQSSISDGICRCVCNNF